MSVETCPFCDRAPSRIRSGVEFTIVCLGSDCRVRPKVVENNRDRAIAEWNWPFTGGGS